MADAQTISVPEVVNMTQSAAEEKLKSVGLMVDTVTTVASANVPRKRTVHI